MPRRPVRAGRKPGDLTGGRLFKRVVTHWSGLHHAEWRVLATMAGTALDDPDPARGLEAALYWGGHAHLARALGTPDPDAADPRSVARWNGALRNMRRYVSGLIEVKAIEIVDTGQMIRDGHAQTYRLLVEQGSYYPAQQGNGYPAQQGKDYPPRNQ